MTHRFVDIHVLQTVPPSNINRDDTGSPKTAIYGGCRRARVSSQAWKKAVRQSFDEFVDPSQRGHRTLRVVELIMNSMAEQHPEIPEEERRERAIEVVKALGLKVAKPRQRDKDAEPGIERSEYLVFYSRSQIERLAEIAATAEDGKLDREAKKEAKVAADSDHGIDVSLFGRMVADSKDLNVDAAVQVAHAISTHAVETESDYFTAVDDFKLDEDDAGAGMIGTVEFNSSTLYRFATVAVDQLMHNLGDAALTAEAAAAFVRGFVTSMPTGKQNTFANNTLPDAVVVQVREGRSTSWVGAFEEPVATSSQGYVRGSCEAMASYAHDLQEGFAGQPIASFVTRVGDQTAALADLGEQKNIDDLVEAVRENVTTELAEEQG